MRRCRIPMAVVAVALVGPAWGCELAQPASADGSGVCSDALVHSSLPPELEETSGVAASRDHAGVFWTHNDSGGDPAVFAIDSAGRILGRVRVAGATNRDWEDIAIGPCDEDGSTCLFIADIGDNSERHDRVAFYRVPEPDPRRDTVTAEATIFRARYPDGPRDAEAAFVTAAGIHVLNKGRSDAIELFRLAPPYQAGEIVPFERLQQVAPPPTSVSAQVTAAAASTEGRHVVVRTYAGLRFFRVEGDTLVPWGRTADVVVPQQMQGEGVGWIGDGRFVVTSESRGQQGPSIAIIHCEPERPHPDSTDTPPDTVDRPADTAEPPSDSVGASPRPSSSPPGDSAR